MYFLFKSHNPTKGCPSDLNEFVADQLFQSVAEFNRFLESLPSDEYESRFWWQSAWNVRENPTRKLPRTLWMMSPKKNLSFDYFNNGGFYLSDAFLSICQAFDPGAVSHTQLISVDHHQRPNTHKKYNFAHAMRFEAVLEPRRARKLNQDLEVPQTSVCLGDYIDEGTEPAFDFMEIEDIEAIVSPAISDRLHASLVNSDMKGMLCVPPNEIWITNYNLIGKTPFQVPPHPRHGSLWSDDLPCLYA